MNLLDVLGKMPAQVWNAGNSGNPAVSGFWSMIGGAFQQKNEFLLSEGSRVHSKILDEITRKLEAQARAAIDCITDPINGGSKYSGDIVTYGGKLFSNPFSLAWGPFTYNFYTIGSAQTYGDSTFNGYKEKCCCYRVKFNVDIAIHDVFDYVPDRSVPNNATPGAYLYAFLYDIPALFWSGLFNGALEASQPDVWGFFKKNWEATICKEK